MNSSSVTGAGMWQLCGWRAGGGGRGGESPLLFTSSGLWSGPHSTEGSGRKKVTTMKKLVVFLLCVVLLTTYTGKEMSEWTAEYKLWGDVWIKRITFIRGFRSLSQVRTQHNNNDHIHDSFAWIWCIFFLLHEFLMFHNYFVCIFSYLFAPILYFTAIPYIIDACILALTTK